MYSHVMLEAQNTFSKAEEIRQATIWLSSLRFAECVCRCVDLYEAGGGYFLQLPISVSEVHEKMRSSLTPPSSCEDVVPTSWALLSHFCINNDFSAFVKWTWLTWLCIELMGWNGSVSIILIVADSFEYLTQSVRKLSASISCDVLVQPDMHHFFSFCWNNFTFQTLSISSEAIGVTYASWCYWERGFHTSGCSHWIFKDVDKLCEPLAKRTRNWNKIPRPNICAWLLAGPTWANFACFSWGQYSPANLRWTEFW